MTRRAALCILLTPLQAFAAPTIAVVGVHQPELTEAAQTAMVQQLVEAIDTGGKADALTLQEFHASLAGREEVALREGLLGEGRRLLGEGRNLYNQAAWQDAIPVFDGAVTALERSIPGSNTTRELWEAWVYLGACHLQLDAAAEASSAFQAAIALSAGRQPDAAVFPPDLTTAYDAARAGLVAQATTLVIGGDVGAAAAVFVDGEPAGPAPITISGVLPGKHYINLRAASGTGSAEIYVPPPEGGAAPAPVNLDVPLGPPSLGASEESAAARGRQNAAFYRALGGQSTADYLLLAGVDGTTLSLQLYSRAIDAFSKVTEVPVSGTADDELIAAIPLLLAAVSDGGGLAAGATSPVSPPFSIGTNPIVAQLLLQPERFAPKVAGGGGGGSTDEKRGNGLLIGGVVGGAVLVGGGVALTAVLLGGGEPEPATGSVTVGPF